MFRPLRLIDSTREKELSRTFTRRTRLVAVTAGLALGASPVLLTGTADAAGTAHHGAAHRHHRHHRPAPVKLDLLAINDFHGNLKPIPSSSSSGRINSTPAGGAEYLATHLDRLRARAAARGARAITVAAGDLIGASPLLSAAFHDEPTIEAMNRMGLQIASVGNHEFDEGYKELLRMQNGGCLDDGDGANNQNSCPDTAQPFRGAKFQYLSANVRYAGTHTTVFPSAVVKKVHGIKVGFIGMTLKDTPNIVTKAGVEGLEFTDEVATANQVARQLNRQGVKSIVVLLHQGAVPSDLTQYDGCVGVDGPGLTIAK
jgi:5'-nucleotidase